MLAAQLPAAPAPVAPSMPPGPGRPSKEPDLSTYGGRFAARLRELRERAGWNAEELRDRLADAGLSVTAVSIYRWERGERTPAVNDFPAIAEAYGLTPRGILPPK